MRTLIVDAYDSFVYTIYQYFLELDAGPEVVRSGRVNPALVLDDPPDLVVLGPGPGHPVESGHVELVRLLQGRVPLLGVCLGHQAIGVAFGGTVGRARRLVHGKTSVIDHDGRGLFTGYRSTFRATRYHSLVVDEESVPDELEVTARARDDGSVMGLRHRSLPIESVQFHPESICTEGGHGIFRSFLDGLLPDGADVGRTRAARTVARAVEA